MLGQRNVAAGAASSPVPLIALKAYLSIPVSDTTRDVALTFALAAAVEQVELFTDRIIVARDITERILDYPESRSMVMTHRPIISVTSVTDEKGQVVDPSLYEIFHSSGQLAMTKRVAWCGDYTVVYRAGWTAMPQPIILAIMEMAKDNELGAERDDNVVVRQSPDIGQETTAAGIHGATALGGMPPLVPKGVARALRPYVRSWS